MTQSKDASSNLPITLFPTPSRELMPAQSERCVTRWCSGWNRASTHFCTTCWGLLTPEERLVYMQAVHAPFWPLWLEGMEPGDAVLNGVALRINHVDADRSDGVPVIFYESENGERSAANFGAAIAVFERESSLAALMLEFNWQERQRRMYAKRGTEIKAERASVDGDPLEGSALDRDTKRKLKNPLRLR